MKFIFILAFNLCSTLVVGQINSDSITMRLTSMLDSFPNKTYLSIALIKQEDIKYIGLFKDEEGCLELDLRDSLFEIGSITKVFTASVLAKYLSENTIKPEDEINNLFDYDFNEDIKLNYISLSNHTSRLPRLPSNILPFFYQNPTNPYKNYSYSDLDSYMKNEMSLQDESKANYTYSNLGAGILAYALCEKQDLNFEDLLQKEIFKPNNMNSTSFDLITSITGFNKDGSRIKNWTFNALQGAGGLISCTSDLVKFIHAQFDDTNEGLKLSRKETYIVSENMSMGLAWHILKDEDEKYWHNGGTGGFTSSIAFRTSNNTGVVVLSNLSALNKLAPLIDEICFTMLDSLN